MNDTRADTAYARVSGDGQGDDLPTQDRVNDRYYEGEGIDPAGVLRFVDIESRDRSERRKDFQKLIALAQAGKVRRIAVSRFDRWGVKGALEWGHYGFLLQQAGCRLVESSTGRDLIVDGDLVTDLRGVIDATTSAKEQREKGLRSLQGKNRRAKEESRRCGGVAAFGSDRCCLDARDEVLWFFVYESRSHGFQVFPCERCRTTPRGREGNSICPDCRRVACRKGNMPRADGRSGQRVVPVPSERQERVEIVRQIFEWFTTRAEFTTGVAALCNKRGWAIYGKRFTHEAIRQIVSNPAHAGFFAFGRTAVSRFVERDGEKVAEMAPDARRGRRPGKSPVVRPGWCVPLVEPAVFEAAQKKLAGHKGKPRAPRNREAWLAGILHCGKCKKPMKPRKVRGRLLYCCRSRYYADVYGNPHGCGYHTVGHDAAVRLVRDKLAALGEALTSPDAKKRVLALYRAKGQKLDDIARLVKDGAVEFADALAERFKNEGDGKLAGMVAAFKAVFDVTPGHEREWLLDFLCWEAADIGPDDTAGTDAVALGRLMAAIEAEAARLAATRLEKVRKELDDVYDMMLHDRRSDQHGQWLERKRVQLEKEQGALEQQAVPLGERHARLMEEVDDLAARIRAAEDPLADSEPMRKHEAVRNVLGRIYLFFEARGRTSVMMPERATFECAPGAIPTASPSTRSAGRRW
jgi:predicted site-specific integrase-resolvase